MCIWYEVHHDGSSKSCMWKSGLGWFFFLSVFTKRLSWNGSLSVSVLGLLLTLLQRHPWSCPDVICSFLLWYSSLSNSLHLSVHNILSHTRFMNGIMENGKAIMSLSKFLSQKHRIFSLEFGKVMLCEGCNYSNACPKTWFWGFSFWFSFEGILKGTSFLLCF